MNLQILRSECKVSGAMSFVLYLLRMIGLAPLKFKRVHDGWRVRVSHYHRCYSLVASLMLVFFLTLAVLGNILLSVWAKKKTRFLTGRIMWLVEAFNIVLVVFTAACTSTNRMRHMIDCIAQLHQINEELQRYHQPSHINGGQTWRMVIYLIIFGCFVVILDYVLFIAKVINMSGEVTLTAFHLFYTISNMVLLLIVIQLTLTVMWVLLDLQLLNSGLQNVLQEIYKNTATSSLTPLYPESILIRNERRQRISNAFTRKNTVGVDLVMTGINKGLETAPAVLHRMAQLYCALCDVIRQLNDSHGLLLLLLYMSFLQHLVIASYHVAVQFSQPELTTAVKLLSQLSWAVFHFVKLVVMTEPCHRTHEQMAFSKSLLNQMLRYTSSDNFGIMSKLKSFQRHLVLNEVYFSLRQFFTVNRTLGATIIGSITTYLVIAFQFLYNIT